MAKNIAPGIHRNFSAERWSQISEKVWREERERARDSVRHEVDFLGIGTDIDSSVLDLARYNAEKAGVADIVRFERTDIKDISFETERGTLICNPPYGERLLDMKQADEIYRVMGKKFERKRGWSYSIISPSETFEDEFGRKADKRRKLYNGMIKCTLYMYFK